MKVYICGNCQQPLYFENSVCLSCQHPVGFDAAKLSMITLEKEEAISIPLPAKEKAAVTPKKEKNMTPSGTGGNPPEQETVTPYSDITNRKVMYKFCQNANFASCNWLIPIKQSSPFCPACQLNRVIPSLSDPKLLARWQRIEVAKHRLVYSLFRLRLPVAPKETKDGDGIAFDFMAQLSGQPRIMTGHANGVITLNIEEADEAERARNKLDLGEKYRTLLGHFRHEIGHYYWDLLISGGPLQDDFRKLFGDEQKDYGEALKTYYQNGAPQNWTDNFISPYSSAHPWEDWAETWAHYMHLMDTLETAYSFGISIHPAKVEELDANISKDPYEDKKFQRIIDRWLPLTFAVNSLNRSMGHSDFYPFVISSVVVEKLRFIHETVKNYDKLISQISKR
jgi:hypothetical protein